MEKYILLDKKIGQTPLEALQAWRNTNPEYAEVPACYAGRLDPMASGLILILLGDECKNQEHYHNFDKEYEVEVLLDIGSDTGDILGIVEPTGTETHPTNTEITSVLRTEEGTHIHPYPIFSSKTVNGTPLFLHTLRGTLDETEIPTHEETFHKIELLSSNSISHTELQTRIKELLALAPKSDEASKELGADFRIHTVRNSWQTVFLEPERTYTILKLRVHCGPGAYMRTLAQRIGKHLGTQALALSIRRTRIGNFTTTHIDK